MPWSDAGQSAVELDVSGDDASRTGRGRGLLGAGRWRRIAAWLGMSVAVPAVVPAAALGHAAFQSATPEPGARVQSPPAQIAIVFSEPLNRELTTAKLFTARSGRRLSASVAFGPANRLLLRPGRRLPTGAFTVRWHTVSILDGHALEGTFGFGVRTSAIGHEQQLEESPLARGGWLRVALRTLWYAAVFFFGGGLLCALALRSQPGPASWLIAGEGTAAVAPRGGPDAAARRIWARTRAAGWLAVAAGIGVAIAETQDAAGSLSWRAIDAYLLSTVSGGARAVAVACVALAALLAGRAWRIATVALLAALAAVAVGGHANSASPRTLALLSDWVHLVAGTAWIGGIAQIVATWLPGIHGLPFGERRRVVLAVLDRFGRLALPAAVVVVSAGIISALIELGSLSELWRSGYGRVLMVKSALVAALLAVSYVHAFRLRPRVITWKDGHATAERRHWRLLRGQPALAGVVLGAGALLAVFPLPPRELLEQAGTQTVAVAALRPPTAHQLAVAEEAGPWIAAAWVNRTSNAASGMIRLLDYKIRPVPASIEIHGARTHGCGAGCVTFTVAPVSSLRVIARLGQHAAAAVIPIAWHTTGTPAAERILRRSVLAVDRLRSWQIAERLTGGLGGLPAIGHYRIGNRHDYQIAYRGAGFGETIEIGPRAWVREPNGSWQGSVGSQLDTRELMPWWTHRTAVRLLDLTTAAGRPVADIALADIHRPVVKIPFWFRLRIDLRSMLPLSMRMITAAHFMDQRYYAFDVPVTIRPPATGR